MWNIKFKKIVAFACVLLLQPMLHTGSFALAKKKRPAKAFSFIAEGGKASQGECDGEWKIPKLKRLKEYGNSSAYMGSELQNPEITKGADEMWKHFFKAKPSCNQVLAKTPSSIAPAAKSTKELPPEDPADSEDDGDKPDSPEKPDSADSE